MQVGKDRVKGYFLAGLHPVSNDPFLPLFCPLLLPVPFGFRQRLCRYFGSGPTFVNKVIPVKTGQDWPRPPKTAQDILDYLYKCVPCLVTFPFTDSAFLASRGKTRGAPADSGANHIDPGIGR